ncbi:excisionase family DNA-binding protein [Roseibium sp. MMSF_3544]|uniref:excisionase family DNA-binding protein n=1 Tax=unclassified Roseibium TaxID=2629323 RepID=UPI00273F9CE7|nr:helix-turn-helix domain-containing protein [Roseibium sp. MMSF_3544]
MPSAYLEGKAAKQKELAEKARAMRDSQNPPPDADEIKSKLAELLKELRELKERAAVGGEGWKGFEDACKFIGCSRETLYRKVRANELTMYRIGSKPLFKVSELNQLPKAAA